MKATNNFIFSQFPSFFRIRKRHAKLYHEIMNIIMFLNRFNCKANNHNIDIIIKNIMRRNTENAKSYRIFMNKNTCVGITVSNFGRIIRELMNALKSVNHICIANLLLNQFSLLPYSNFMRRASTST